VSPFWYYDKIVKNVALKVHGFTWNVYLRNHQCLVFGKAGKELILDWLVAFGMNLCATSCHRV